MKIKLDHGATLPTRAHYTDAGLDLYSMEEKTIMPRHISYTELQSGKAKLLPMGETFDTGVHMEIPKGYFGKLESRSGLNVKHHVVSCGGVIDSGYTGSIKVKLYNFGSEPYIVHKGDKICQIIIQPCLCDALQVVDELEETERGENGFGSTGA